MHSVDIYRGTNLLVTVKLDDSSQNSQNKSVMGDNFLQLSFSMRSYISFLINDSCTVFGEVYKISEQPVVKKVNSNLYQYTVKLQSQAYDLAKVLFLGLGNDTTLTETDFSLMGNAQTFINLILQNVSRVYTGWTSGEVITTDYKLITFSRDSCLSALTKIAQAFATEFWVIGSQILLTQKVNDKGITFRHGRAKGLYDITRQNNSNSSIITRLYVFGSDKNLPPDYGSTRLRLPGVNRYVISNLTCNYVDNGNGTLTFTFSFDIPVLVPPLAEIKIAYKPTVPGPTWGGGWGGYTYNNSPLTPISITVPGSVGDSYDFIFTTAGVSTPQISINASIVVPTLITTSLPYVENNVTKYGVIEQTEVFDGQNNIEIYPHRTGIISSVDATDVYSFFDTGLDFDINAYLLPGTAAKVVFNTGQLSGYSFDIKAYDSTSKKITILKNKDETSLDIPSSLFKPAIGDQYVLVDLQMPTSYIDKAENDLLTTAQTLLATISQPQYTYVVTIDPTFIKSKGYSLDIGDLIWLTDTQLEVDRKIRIINVVRNVVNEYQYQIQLSDVVSQGTISQIQNNLTITSTAVSNINSQLAGNAILNGKVIGDLEIDQGTVVFKDIPTTSTLTGFSELVMEDATGKIHKKV